MNTEAYDVIIVGAGAAGMMSAIEAGKRGRKVLLVDHSKKIGEKIRISGGGQCNFTNIHTKPNKFISQNPKFVISALNQYTQNDFINLFLFIINNIAMLMIINKKKLMKSLNAKMINTV